MGFIVLPPPCWDTTTRGSPSARHLPILSAAFPVWVAVWVKTQFVSNVQASIFHISVRPTLFFLVDLTINS